MIMIPPHDAKFTIEDIQAVSSQPEAVLPKMYVTCEGQTINAAVCRHPQTAEIITTQANPRTSLNKCIGMIGVETFPYTSYNTKMTEVAAPEIKRPSTRPESHGYGCPPQDTPSKNRTSPATSKNIPM